jgi:Ca2+:H+ antiporter
VLAGLSRKELVLISAVVLLTAVTGFFHVSAEEAFGTFLLATAALAGLAWLVGFATEQLGERFGPDVTGLMQSTLGNLPEFFVVIFALRAGETVVAQTSILGSIFANALLVLGLTVVVGAWKSRDGVMRFSSRLPNDTATLLLLAVFLIVMIALSVGASDKASHHVNEISFAGAICLLIVYMSWVIPYVRSDAAGDPAHRSVPRIGVAVSAGLLGLAGVGAAFVSEWFVASLRPAIDTLGISSAFAGIVIVAIAGNAVENAAAVMFAARNQADLAISVVKNSVAQIAVFLFPLLVLVSFLFEPHLTFQLAPVMVGTLALTAITLWQVTGDGEAAAFEGFALIALYVMIAILALYE